MQRFLNSTRRSIAWLKKQATEGHLQMKPPFQRNPVWTDRQRSYLVDTILRGYPVPEIYMQELVDENGEEIFILVDGQQRVRACLEFIEGKYSLNSEDAPDWPDMKFEELSPAEKKRFYAYSFVERQLPEMPDEEIRNIFQRLNRNVVALNKQELRHSTYWGEFISTMEGLADHHYWEGTGIFTANDIRRMLDVEFISELAIGVIHGPQNKKASLEKWYQVYELEFDQRRDVEQTFAAVLGELGQVFPNIRQTRWRKKSDFYTLFLVLAKHKAGLPLAREKRDVCSERLEVFGTNVDTFLTEGGPATKIVRDYANAVQRAASDLANRRKRAEILEQDLIDLF